MQVIVGAVRGVRGDELEGHRRVQAQAVQAALRPFPVDRAVPQVAHPFQDGRTRHDAGDEQLELAAHAEVDIRALPPQPFREPARLREVFEDVPLRDVTEGRLEPDVQPAFGGLGSGGSEAFDAVAGDIDGVGVQVVADGAQVGAHPGRVESGGRGLSLADGVHDTLCASRRPLAATRPAGSTAAERPTRPPGTAPG
ncbi:hypothetical protein [Streptomyces phaeoluteigriseus]